jgi:hypothetical protein
LDLCTRRSRTGIKKPSSLQPARATHFLSYKQKQRDSLPRQPGERTRKDYRGTACRIKQPLQSALKKYVKETYIKVKKNGFNLLLIFKELSLQRNEEHIGFRQHQPESSLFYYFITNI